MIVRFCIPIPDYYRENVFYKQIYFKSKKCPTLEQVKNFCKKESELEDLELIPCTEFADCLDSLSRIDGDWPMVGGQLIQANCFVNQPMFGKVPLTATIITPVELL